MGGLWSILDTENERKFHHCITSGSIALNSSRIYPLAPSLIVTVSVNVPITSHLEVHPQMIESVAL